MGPIQGRFDSARDIYPTRLIAIRIIASSLPFLQKLLIDRSNSNTLPLVACLAAVEGNLQSCEPAPYRRRKTCHQC